MIFSRVTPHCAAPGPCGPLGRHRLGAADTRACDLAGAVKRKVQAALCRPGRASSRSPPAPIGPPASGDGAAQVNGRRAPRWTDRRRRFSRQAAARPTPSLGSPPAHQPAQRPQKHEGTTRYRLGCPLAPVPRSVWLLMRASMAARHGATRLRDHAACDLPRRVRSSARPGVPLALDSSGTQTVASGARRTPARASRPLP
jgi:hypothetical protein